MTIKECKKYANLSNGEYFSLLIGDYFYIRKQFNDNTDVKYKNVFNIKVDNIATEENLKATLKKYGL